MPMDSENTLYHVMSLQGALPQSVIARSTSVRRSNLILRRLLRACGARNDMMKGRLLRLRLAMTGRNAAGATLPFLGTAFKTVSTVASSEQALRLGLCWGHRRAKNLAEAELLHSKKAWRWGKVFGLRKLCLRLPLQAQGAFFAE